MQWKPGVLSDRELRLSVQAEWVKAATPIEEAQFQPASLDLRLGSVAYQLRASFLPSPQTVLSRLSQTDLVHSDLVIDQLSLDGGATLQRNKVYLVPLQESLALPEHVRGRCNPKSTTGRLDIFTRVITDETSRFDEIKPGYQGPLYLEICPQSFPIRVHQGVSLNQVRFAWGRSIVPDAVLERRYKAQPLLYDDDHRPIPFDASTFRDGLSMGIDLSGRVTDGVIGYRAVEDPQAVDLSRVGAYDPSEFWEPIKKPGRESFVLAANRFYILVSNERIRVPPDLAAEMVVYDAGAGEIRTHYAGFFDPGFGFGDGSILGTKVVMEVRAREVPFMVYHGQTLFRVVFERMMNSPELVYGVGRASSYQHQTLTLSKQFRRS